MGNEKRSVGEDRRGEGSSNCAVEWEGEGRISGDGKGGSFEVRIGDVGVWNSSMNSSTA